MTYPAGQLEFPDAVRTVRAWLLAQSVGVDVVSEIPNPRPASFVEVDRTGGTARASGVVDFAFITVDSWAPTKPAAMSLAQRTRRLIHAMGGQTVDGVRVGHIQELAGPAQVPDDDDSLSPRVRQSFQVPLGGALPQ